METSNRWADLCLGLQIQKTGIVKIAFAELDPASSLEPEKDPKKFSAVNSLTMHVSTFAHLVHSIQQMCEDPSLRKYVDQVSELVNAADKRRTGDAGKPPPEDGEVEWTEAFSQMQDQSPA